MEASLGRISKDEQKASGVYVSSNDILFELLMRGNPMDLIHQSWNWRFRKEIVEATRSDPRTGWQAFGAVAQRNVEITNPDGSVTYDTVYRMRNKELGDMWTSMNFGEGAMAKLEMPGGAMTGLTAASADDGWETLLPDFYSEYSERCETRAGFPTMSQPSGSTTWIALSGQASDSPAARPPPPQHTRMRSGVWPS